MVTFTEEIPNEKLHSLRNANIKSKFWALARKEKNSAFCINWEIKHSWRVWGQCGPLNGFSGEIWDKTIVTFTILNLKLV